MLYFFPAEFGTEDMDTDANVDSSKAKVGKNLLLCLCYVFSPKVEDLF